MPTHPLEPLLALDGVAAAVDEARQACETLRWHRALRRQWGVARIEAGVRAAWAGAELDGLRVPLDLVRDVARGAVAPPAGPDGDALAGAVRVQAAVEQRMAAPGAPHADRTPAGQLLAHLHAAVVADDAAGRLRAEEPPADLRGLGAAPTGPELAGRVAALTELMGGRLPAHVPALLLVAVVHGELVTLRPFTRGNGAVARAMTRHLLTAGGVDPVGVVVPEVRWAAEPTVYLSAAARYATGTPEGVGHWLRYCAASVVSGAAQGTTVADAVLAGRLGA